MIKVQKRDVSFWPTIKVQIKYKKGKVSFLAHFGPERTLFLLLTEVMQDKVQKLKECFRQNSIRSYPRYDLEDKFILTTDYSKENLGAILSHVQGGKEE